jgi:hypothetical protein
MQIRYNYYQFAKIHIYFAVFFIVALTVAIKLVAWLHSLHGLPDRRYDFWYPIITVIYFVLTYGATLFWLLFAIYHLFVIVRQMFHRKDKN